MKKTAIKYILPSLMALVIGITSTHFYEHREHANDPVCYLTFGASANNTIENFEAPLSGRPGAICWHGILDAYIKSVDESPSAAARRDLSNIKKDTIHGRDERGLRAGFSFPYDGRPI